MFISSYLYEEAVAASAVAAGLISLSRQVLKDLFVYSYKLFLFSKNNLTHVLLNGRKCKISKLRIIHPLLHMANFLV